MPMFSVHIHDYVVLIKILMLIWRIKCMMAHSIVGQSFGHIWKSPFICIGHKCNFVSIVGNSVPICNKFERVCR